MSRYSTDARSVVNAMIVIAQRVGLPRTVAKNAGRSSSPAAFVGLPSVATMSNIPVSLIAGAFSFQMNCSAGTSGVTPAGGAASAGSAR